MKILRSAVKKILPASVIEARRRRLQVERQLKRQLEQEDPRYQQEHSMWMSQAGQDLWVYGNVFNEKRDGFFLEVGAHDGVELSNTFVLETRYGWNGISVEANPTTFALLKSNRSSLCVHACVSSHRETVEFSVNDKRGGIVAADCDVRERDACENIVSMETVPLESILDEAIAPSVIDYFSIDIEGAEDRALLEFPFNRYQFTCITIERPSDALRKVLAENGYLLVAEIPGLDAFYIHDSHRQSYHRNILNFYQKPLAYAPRNQQ